MRIDILNRFWYEASQGAEVWYVLNESWGAEHGFLLNEPTAEGKPWVFTGGQYSVDRMLERVPQAIRIWIIPGEVGDAFVKAQGLACI